MAIAAVFEVPGMNAHHFDEISTVHSMSRA